MIAPIILAAGRSTRFEDPKTKLLHQLKEVEILKRVVRNVERAGFRTVNIVVGHQRYDVFKSLGDKYNYIIQEEQRGTGHAVKCCRGKVQADDIFVLFGDKPLFRPQTIKEFIESHKNIITVATIRHPVPETYSEGYGTVIRSEYNIVALRKVVGTVECDAGLYLFNTEWLWKNIDLLQPHGLKNEYFLPDLVEVGWRQGVTIGEYRVKNYREAIGINNKRQFKEAEQYLLE